MFREKNCAQIFMAALLAALLLAAGLWYALGTREGSGSLTCTLSISCAPVLDHMELCDPDKAELIPADGILLPTTQVSFSQGETVLDVLKRACAQNSIHLEHASSLYGAYVEGMGNLYSRDVGDQSGWLYAVNGTLTDQACDAYPLEDGDSILWLYICDYPADIAGLTG